MKKFIAVAAMLSVMFFGFGTSQALIGVPDDVPGTDILVPFFYVSMPGFGDENTLITITDVKAPGGYNGLPGIQGTNLRMRVYTIDSFCVHDAPVRLTPFDVYSDNMMRIIVEDMSPAAIAALATDTDLVPGDDHYAGYVIFFNNSYPNFALPAIPPWDNLISHIYQVYLSAGMAASYNGVSWEWDTAFVDPVRQLGIFGDEAFSANALYTGKWLLGAAAPAPVNAAWFRLMARYFIMDDVADSLLMIWLEANLSAAPAGFDPTILSPIPVPGVLHCYFFNEDEDVFSAFIPLIHELNIINVRDIVPGGLFVDYPWGGWINISTPDDFGVGWNYPVWDPTLPGFRMTDLGAYRQWVAYSWQRAIGPAAEAWEVIHPVHRDADIGPNFVPAPWW
jgi:hypothetical protein